MPSGDADVSRETSRSLPPWAEPARELLESFESTLATAGVERGLIGPREVPRLWNRHILNCLVVADPAAALVPPGSTVADVGSGAGLPGLVWAIGRPDIRMVLVEPLLRRSTFLTETVADLGIADRVTVVRTRAEDLVRSGDLLDGRGADVVTARAVAPLERLLGWTVPLLREGGRLVALKGSSAAAEIASAAPVAAALGVRELRIEICGAQWVEPATSVVVGERRTAE